jgi:hypothetical protein
MQVVRSSRLGSDGFWKEDTARITGGGSGYAAILAHAGGVLYGTELGSVTLKRVGFFCFPIKHSTHTNVAQNSQKVLPTLTFCRWSTQGGVEHPRPGGGARKVQCLQGMGRGQTQDAVEQRDRLAAAAQIMCEACVMCCV